MRNLVRALVAMLILALVVGPSGSALDLDLGAPSTADAPAGAADPSVAGNWLAPFDAEVPAVNMILLNDGRVLYFSGLEADDADSDPTHAIFFTTHPLAGQSRVIDFSTDPPTVVTPDFADGAGQDLFCSGQTILPDGRVLVAGGSDWHTLPPEGNPTSVPLDGSRDARVFDPTTNTWSRLSDMIEWRWYPSVISQPDGEPLSASGIWHLVDPASHVDTIETYDSHNDEWSFLEDGDQLLPLYPRLSFVPGGPLKGDLFYNTVGTMWGPFGEHPLEATWSWQKTYDEGSGWRDLGLSAYGVRQHGSSVMLPLSSDDGYAPTFVTFGGALYRNILATDATEINDLSTDPPTNRIVDNMNHPRWHLNGVLLPDGKVLAVGGGLYDNVYLHGQENIPVLPAEIFDPATETWTEVAEMEVPRMYHSTSVLLPDGRVLVGGHVPLPNPFWAARNEVAPGVGPANPQYFETRMEIYEPPYLFRGDRPVIWDAPDEIGYDATFWIETSELDPLDSAVLVRPGATTHSFDSTSRAIELDVIQHNGVAVELVAPPDGDVAPPGWYMLFINKEHPDGPVPSEAKWVHLS